MERNTIWGLVLAAGASERFGRLKLVEPLAGEPLVRRAVRTLQDAGLPVLVVVGRDSVLVREALAGMDVRLVHNADAAEGMAGSIRCGVASLPADAEAVVILPGDQPLTPAGLVAELCRTHARTGAGAAAPRYQGVHGPPVLFSRSLFPALLALQGDRGARAVLEADPAAVAVVELDVPMPRDVDTRADYEVLESFLDPSA